MDVAEALAVICSDYEYLSRLANSPMNKSILLAYQTIAGTFGEMQAQIKTLEATNKNLYAMYNNCEKLHDLHFRKMRELQQQISGISSMQDSHADWLENLSQAMAPSLQFDDIEEISSKLSCLVDSFDENDEREELRKHAEGIMHELDELLNDAEKQTKQPQPPKPNYADLLVRMHILLVQVASNVFPGSVPFSLYTDISKLLEETAPIYANLSSLAPEKSEQPQTTIQDALQAPRDFYFKKFGNRYVVFDHASDETIAVFRKEANASAYCIRESLSKPPKPDYADIGIVAKRLYHVVLMLGCPLDAESEQFVDDALRYAAPILAEAGLLEPEPPDTPTIDPNFTVLHNMIEEEQDDDD